MTSGQLDLPGLDKAPPDRPNQTRNYWAAKASRTPTRAVKAAICPTCHAPVLRALDADICALTVLADPDPITSVGELLAVAAARTTYDLTRHAGHYELEPRRPAHITQERRYPVLVEHRCGAAPLPVDHAAGADIVTTTPSCPTPRRSRRPPMSHPPVDKRHPNIPGSENPPADPTDPRYPMAGQTRKADR